jgi:hypothetical protein
MYKARHQKDHCMLFQPSMRERVITRLEMKTTSARHSAGVHLNYQPIISCNPT